MFDALAVRGEWRAAVQAVNRAVEGLVCFAEIDRHEVGVVEVCKSCVGMGGAGGEYGFGVWCEAL